MVMTGNLKVALVPMHRTNPNISKPGWWTAPLFFIFGFNIRRGGKTILKPLFI
jgi:hypothetical protein